MSRQYNNYGRDQFNFENFWGNLFVTQEHHHRHRNEQILLMSVRDEVESRLSQSLHNAVFLNLGKEAQPDQVERPWGREVKIGSKPVETLLNDTTIFQIFDSPEINGKLLILGQPGSGKTTTLLDLTIILVGKAEEDSSYPIPVLLNLSSWQNEKQLIRDWMITELKSKYGVNAKLGRQWVSKRIILPLLDGLDEVAPERQEKCVQQINTFLAGESAPLYLVVCSRITEYENYKTPLQLNGAIYLQELSDQQIQEYLIKVARGELWQVLSRSVELQEFVRVPLLLSIAVLAYPKDSTEQWQSLQTANDRLQYLLDAYVERMLHRQFDSCAYGKRKDPSVQQTRRWLVWLAQQMEEVSQTEFLIEEMQPYRLPDRLRLRYELVVRLILGLIAVLITGLNFGQSSGLIFGLIFLLSFKRDGFEQVGLQILGLIVGLVVGAIVFFICNLPLVTFAKMEYLIYWLVYWQLLRMILDSESTISPIETLRVSWARFARGSLIFGLSLGLILGLFWGLNMLVWSLFWGLLVGLFWGLLFGLSDGLIDVRTTPNQGIKRSATNGLIGGLIGGLIAQLSGSLIFGLFFGGFSCIQHFTLRLFLYKNKAIPWNYARFLDYCTERLFLQRVGGRYRFVHKLLQEHFAIMPIAR